MENLNLNNCYKFSTNVKDHIEMDMGWIVSEWRKLRRTIPEPGLDSISYFIPLRIKKPGAKSILYPIYILNLVSFYLICSTYFGKWGFFDSLN
jgi:hypothetical protein